VISLVAAMPLHALAQRPVSPGNIAPGSPGIASPLPGDVIPQGSPIPRVLPPAPPVVGPGPGAPLAAPAPVPTGSVAVRSVRVEGVSAYAAPQTQAVTAGLVGPSIPLARIEAARTALLNLYRGDGYALTTVTARVEPNGALRFIVVEGRIAEVKLEGDIGPAGTQVLRFLNHLTELRPLDTASLERWLLLAQDIPGVTVRAVLRPSTGEPGALTLVAQVDRQAIAGLLNVDNRASRFTGPIEGLALLDLNSFTEFGERTEATFYHTDGSTQNFGQLTTEAFLGGSGLRGRLYGGYGDADPSGFLRDARYHGTTTVFGGALTYPLIRARQQTLNLSGYFDAIETRITQIAVTGTGLQRGFDSLRVARLGADYAVQDGLLGDIRPAISTVNVRLSQGIPAFGATSNDNTEATRVGERVDFTKFVADLSRVQTLFSLWSDSTVAIKGRIIGQYSGQILPPAEKFYLGGPEFTRGFYSGEVTGDSAFVWQAELQLNTSYDLQVFDRTFNIAAQFYAFYDRGEVWQNQSAQLETPYTRVSSMGIGVRMNVTRFTEFNLEGVHRNTRLVEGTAPFVSPLKADAAYWRVITRF
jgi:hemolysin activation/secretion protein